MQQQSKRAYDGGGGPPRSRRALLPGPKPSTLHGADINQRPGCDRVSNVVITRVNDIHYPVTLDALHTIFSVYGVIDKIVTFDKGGGFQALIQYQTTQPAIDAYDALDDQQMYEGCNLLRIGYSNLTDITVKHNCERSWDYRTNGMPPSGRFKRAASDSATSLNQRERGLKRDNHNSHGSGRENSSSTPRQQQQQQSAGAHTENSHVCHSCGQPGHIAKHCPMGTGIDRVCHLCGEVGHLARNCPRQRSDGTLDTDSRACHACGKLGHLARNCPRLIDGPATARNDNGSWGVLARQGRVESHMIPIVGGNIGNESPVRNGVYQSPLYSAPSYDYYRNRQQQASPSIYESGGDQYPMNNYGRDTYQHQLPPPQGTIYQLTQHQPNPHQRQSLPVNQQQVPPQVQMQSPLDYQLQQQPMYRPYGFLPQQQQQQQCQITPHPRAALVTSNPSVVAALGDAMSVGQHDSYKMQQYHGKSRHHGTSQSNSLKRPPSPMRNPYDNTKFNRQLTLQQNSSNLLHYGPGGEGMQLNNGRIGSHPHSQQHHYQMNHNRNFQHVWQDSHDEQSKYGHGSAFRNSDSYSSTSRSNNSTKNKKHQFQQPQPTHRSPRHGDKKLKILKHRRGDAPQKRSNENQEMAENLDEEEINNGQAQQFLKSEEKRGERGLKRSESSKNGMEGQTENAICVMEAVDGSKSTTATRISDDSLVQQKRHNPGSGRAIATPTADANATDAMEGLSLHSGESTPSRPSTDSKLQQVNSSRSQVGEELFGCEVDQQGAEVGKEYSSEDQPRLQRQRIDSKSSDIASPLLSSSFERQQGEELLQRYASVSETEEGKEIGESVSRDNVAESRDHSSATLSNTLPEEENDVIPLGSKAITPPRVDASILEEHQYLPSKAVPVSPDTNADASCRIIAGAVAEVEAAAIDNIMAEPDLSKPWAEALSGARHSRVLRVMNVDPNACTADILAALFGCYGDVTRVRMPLLSEANEPDDLTVFNASTATALVQFSHPAMAYFARQFLDGCPLAGAHLSVAACPQYVAERSSSGIESVTKDGEKAADISRQNLVEFEIAAGHPAVADFSQRGYLATKTSEKYSAASGEGCEQVDGCSFHRFANTASPGDDAYQASLVPPTTTLRVKGFGASISDQTLIELFSKWKSAGSSSAVSSTGTSSSVVESARDFEDDNRVVDLRRVSESEALVELGSLDAAVSALILSHNYCLDEFDGSLHVSFALGN